MKTFRWFDKLVQKWATPWVLKVVRYIFDLAGDVLVNRFYDELESAMKAASTLRSLWDKIKLVLPFPPAIEELVSEVLRIIEEELRKDLAQANQLGHLGRSPST